MRSMMRHVRHAAWAMAVGAGLAYFLDPDLGADRRRRVRDVVDGLLGPADEATPSTGAPWAASSDDGAPAPDPSTPESPSLLTSPAAALGSV